MASYCQRCCTHIVNGTPVTLNLCCGWWSWIYNNLCSFYILYSSSCWHSLICLKVFSFIIITAILLLRTAALIVTWVHGPWTTLSVLKVCTYYSPHISSTIEPTYLLAKTTIVPLFDQLRSFSGLPHKQSRIPSPTFLESGPMLWLLTTQVDEICLEGDYGLPVYPRGATRM